MVEQSEHTQHSSTQFTDLDECSSWRPETTTIVNIRDYGSQVTITNKVTMGKLEMIWELPKCEQTHKVSKCYEKNGANRFARCRKPSIFKKKKMQNNKTYLKHNKLKTEAVRSQS